MTKATEINKGIMKLGKDCFISIPKLEKVLSDKKPQHIPFKDVRGLRRQKGFAQKRLDTARGFTNHPGIITTDGLLLDGRHRSIARKQSGEKTGIYKVATKKDLMKAKLTPEQVSNLSSKLDELIEFSRDNQITIAQKRGQIRGEDGEYAGSRAALWGYQEPRQLNPNRREKGQPLTIRDDRPVGAIPEVQRQAYKDAKKINKWGKRAANLGSDLNDVVKGNGRKKDLAGRDKKREWEKPYFTTGAATLATTGGLLIAGKRYRGWRVNPKNKAAVAKHDEKIKKVTDKGRSIKGKIENALFSEQEIIPLIEFYDPTRGTIYNKDGSPALRYSDARVNQLGFIAAIQGKGIDVKSTGMKRNPIEISLRRAGFLRLVQEVTF